MVSLLLSHLPLLQPGNTEAKSEYMRLLQKVLAYSIESNAFIEESRQLLSYALIHPATTLEDRNALALWLSHLEERLASGFRTRPEPSYHSRQGSDEWGGTAELGPGEAGPGWQDKPPRENGHVPFHSSTSVPPAINSIGSNANTGEGVLQEAISENGQTGLSSHILWLWETPITSLGLSFFKQYRGWELALPEPNWTYRYILLNPHFGFVLCFYINLVRLYMMVHAYNPSDLGG